jgi:L-alanine-DL-glutamate epimerase-like enolase superfamily enzyme
MKIARVRCVDVGFSRSPATLKRNLVTNASLFEDFDTKPGGWFGPVVCTIVEVESEAGAVGIGSAGAFHNGARSLIETYYTDLVVGEDPRRHGRGADARAGLRLALLRDGRPGCARSGGARVRGAGLPAAEAALWLWAAPGTGRDAAQRGAGARRA